MRGLCGLVGTRTPPSSRVSGAPGLGGHAMGRLSMPRMATLAGARRKRGGRCGLRAGRRHPGVGHHQGDRDGDQRRPDTCLHKTLHGRDSQRLPGTTGDQAGWWTGHGTGGRRPGSDGQQSARGPASFRFAGVHPNPVPAGPAAGHQPSLCRSARGGRQPPRGSSAQSPSSVEYIRIDILRDQARPGRSPRAARTSRNRPVRSSVSSSSATL